MQRIRNHRSAQPIHAGEWLFTDHDPQNSGAPALPDERKEMAKFAGPAIIGLLAEDNRADVLIVEEAISAYDLPIQLYVVPDGEKAVEFIEQAEHDPQAPCPQLLVLDLNLPKVSGHEVLQRLRTSPKCGQVPVLVLTSSDSAKDRKKASSLGANGYFRKPASYAEFLKVGAALKMLLERITGP